MHQYGSPELMEGGEIKYHISSLISVWSVWRNKYSTQCESTFKCTTWNLTHVIHSCDQIFGSSSVQIIYIPCYGFRMRMNILPTAVLYQQS